MSKNIPHEVNGNVNLLLLAGILDEADAKHKAAGEPAYDQTRWAHRCGTPACAIGHWRAFQGRRPEPLSDDEVARMRLEFALDEQGWAQLFGYKPGYAKNAAEAAARIRGFVEERSAARSET